MIIHIISFIFCTIYTLLNQQLQELLKNISRLKLENQKPLLIDIFPLSIPAKITPFLTSHSLAEQLILGTFARMDLHHSGA
ncbi:MAG: hypothetical protein M3413_13655 [Bacteroidota bacterium]|jgi:hypothetical protein|nr:hypothetical protein [Flavisolibacter sp.]MDQ3552559.1 hypothetical protein [Bacteroidota bacterium]